MILVRGVMTSQEVDIGSQEREQVVVEVAMVLLQEAVVVTMTAKEMVKTPLLRQ